MPSGDPLQSSRPEGEDSTAELLAWARGDGAARGPLWDRVYADLRAQAGAFLSRERVGHTLEPTALVHEAWFRLIRAGGVQLESRGHFLALAARAMRQVLVDHARARLADKRGAQRRQMGGSELLQLAEVDLDRDALDLLALEEALEDLRRLSPRLVRVVELRFHGGLTKDEAALSLGVSRNTVDRDWRTARAWLATRLGARGTP
ncbi:MAG: sigma-70 family RNA polymerase sigma factor [Planctomycetaceae bacterium]|nr:sigma-70 family RNA polymerase sigma factor [Planctomycetaceae bacterium]